MASLDARDGRTELEGKEASADAALNSHVSYGVEESGSGEGSLIPSLLLPISLQLQSAMQCC
jgi:hypothetical protein